MSHQKQEAVHLVDDEALLPTCKPEEMVHRNGGENTTPKRSVREGYVMRAKEREVTRKGEHEELRPNQHPGVTWTGMSLTVQA